MGLKSISCPMCGTDIYMDADESEVNCSFCGYAVVVEDQSYKMQNKLLSDAEAMKRKLESFEEGKFKTKAEESDKVKVKAKSALVTELLKEANGDFSSKDYSKAYLMYNKVLEADAGCIEASYKNRLIEQYMMRSAAASYVKCDGFFEEINELIQQSDTSELDKKEADNFYASFCGDIADFADMRITYEKSYVKGHPSESYLDSYISNMAFLLEECIWTLNVASENKRSFSDKYVASAIRMCYIIEKICSALSGRLEYIGAPESIRTVNNGRQEFKYVSKAYIKTLDTEYLEVIARAQNLISANRKEISKKGGAGAVSKANKRVEDEKAAIKAAEQAEINKKIEYKEWIDRMEKSYYSYSKRVAFTGALFYAFLIFTLVSASFVLLRYLINSEYFDSDRFLMAAAIAAVVLCIVFNSFKNHYEKRRGFFKEVLDAENSKLKTMGDSLF